MNEYESNMWTVAINKCNLWASINLGTSFMFVVLFSVINVETWPALVNFSIGVVYFIIGQYMRYQKYVKENEKC